ncbi:hypothetical protein DPMN_093214 [Dreissena polymorpha]|uniref:Uncharacterized protein n=1 Tax=Dreissena polymorpha TaxID=45954 RepID=A0A9D4R0P4_DREPO|nr:hypothetical protein DPMN_093214 [Dreissena polymorpha]
MSERSTAKGLQHTAPLLWPHLSSPAVVFIPETVCSSDHSECISGPKVRPVFPQHW